MRSLNRAYLEDFDKIKVIINTKFEKAFFRPYLYNKDFGMDLKIVSMIEEKKQTTIFLQTPENIEIRKDFYIDYQQPIYLEIGGITSTKSFLDRYISTENLGVFYTTEYTIFRLWAPVCKDVQVIVDQKQYNLTYKCNGVYEGKVMGDLELKEYYYRLRINLDFFNCQDPYAIAKGKNHSVNVIIDPAKTYLMKESPTVAKPFFIYEINVRDFTKNLDIPSPATFIGIKESIDTKFGLTYLKNLGITHLQLMPVNRFFGVNEEIKDPFNSNFSYNWGYNPLEYFTLSGFYATDLEPYTRINEFKAMIDEVHRQNIAINIDVVYNHVYDHQTFPQQLITPGYFFRTDKFGNLRNSSWCGNDMATERPMVRKFIIDNILFFANFYHVDGFRFDLMGLIDAETILQIKEALKKESKDLLIYGEGWQMDTGLDQSLNANMYNAEKIPGVLFFNDYFRNLFKNKDDLKNTLLFDKIPSLQLIENIFKGSIPGTNIDGKTQSINYIECHDNITLYDYLVKTEHAITFQRISKLIIFSQAIKIFSSGISFFHFGEEFLRTKNGIDDSYDKGDAINYVNWNNINLLHESFKDLIYIKKNYLPKDVAFTVNQKKGYFIVSFENKEYKLELIINFDSEIRLYFAPCTTILFDSIKYQNKTISVLDLEPYSVYIIKK